MGSRHRDESFGDPCACCPPNLMRTLSALEQYLATSDGTGVQLHQYATADLRAQVPGGEARLAIRTGYPWHGYAELSRPWRAWDTTVLDLELPVRVTELEELRWDLRREPAAVPRPDLGEVVVGVAVPAGRGDAVWIPC